MKRLSLLVVAALSLVACDSKSKPDFLKSEAEKAAERATPRPVATPTPAPNWMWKDYKNPLNPPKK